MIHFWFLRSYIFIVHNSLVLRIGCSNTLARTMWVKINFTWIWAVITDLGWHKVAPRGKNVNLVQISSTKKTMFAIFRTFKILLISSYPEWTLNENFYSLTLAIFKTKQPIVRFWELSGFVHFLALFMQAQNLNLRHFHFNVHLCH